MNIEQRLYRTVLGQIVALASLLVVIGAEARAQSTFVARGNITWAPTRYADLIDTELTVTLVREDPMDVAPGVYHQRSAVFVFDLEAIPPCPLCHTDGNPCFLTSTEFSSVMGPQRRLS